MSIKIKLKGNGKAMIRFNHQIDEQYFTYIMRLHRDDGQSHPKIILKNKDGSTVPKMPPVQPLPKVPVGEPVVVSEPEVKK